MVTPIGYADIGVELKHDNDPEPWFVTFGVEIEDQGVDGNVGVLNDIGEKFHDNWGDRLTNLLNVIAVHGAFGSDGPDVQDISTFAPKPCSAQSEMLPQNCAALIRKTTNLGGRRGRGRMFMPNVLVESQVTPTGNVGSSLLTSLQTASTSFLIDLATAGATNTSITPMVLLHQPGVSPQPSSPTLVVGLQVDSVISTQRRRLR